MKLGTGSVLITGIVLLAATAALFRVLDQPPDAEPRQLEIDLVADSTAPEGMPSEAEELLQPHPPLVGDAQANGSAADRAEQQRLAQQLESPEALAAALKLAAITNKLDRLTHIRESFRMLATGDPTNALLTAKQLTNPNERETALLTLVTEWTKGELSAPGQRARAISLFGLEAGLGMELARNPDLALLWANELTEGQGRGTLLLQVAGALVESDPAAAFALTSQIPESGRRKFDDSLFAAWAGKDTEAALGWASLLADPAQQDAAVRAIRSVAPVGIGAALSMQQGHPVINELVPGTPAELSGQLRRGDRILALAQGDGPFVDARNLPLPDVVERIRGTPGTVLHLQVMAGDASPDSLPRTVTIVRDQIKFKR